MGEVGKCGMVHIVHMVHSKDLSRARPCLDSPTMSRASQTQKRTTPVAGSNVARPVMNQPCAGLARCRSTVCKPGLVLDICFRMISCEWCSLADVNFPKRGRTRLMKN